MGVRAGSSSEKLSQFKCILFFEFTRIKSNTMLVLGLALHLLVSIMLASYLVNNSEQIHNIANNLSSEKEGFLKMMLEEYRINLNLENIRISPVFSILSLILGSFLPLHALLFGADQIASDVGSKHIRFLLPRIGRSQLLIFRMLSLWLLYGMLATVTVFIMVSYICIMSSSDSLSSGIIYSIKHSGLMLIYLLPFFAISGFFNSFMSNSFLVFLMTQSVWILTAIIAAVGAWVHPAYEYVSYLFPSVMSNYIFSNSLTNFAIGVAGCLGYTLFFSLLGLKILAKRNL